MKRQLYCRGMCKLFNGMIPYNGITLEPIFHQIWITIEKLFVKRTPGHISSQTHANKIFDNLVILDLLFREVGVRNIVVARQSAVAQCNRPKEMLSPDLGEWCAGYKTFKQKQCKWRFELFITDKLLIYTCMFVRINGQRQSGDRKWKQPQPDWYTVHTFHRLSTWIVYCVTAIRCWSILTIGTILLLTWINFSISNYVHHNVWDEITYPFPNLNGAAVEVWGWISNFTSHFNGNVINYPCITVNPC